jgi:hypothetical protein
VIEILPHHTAAAHILQEFPAAQLYDHRHLYGLVPGIWPSYLYGPVLVQAVHTWDGIPVRQFLQKQRVLLLPESRVIENGSLGLDPALRFLPVPFPADHHL